MADSVPFQPPPPPRPTPLQQQQHQRPLLPAAHHFPSEPSTLFLSLLVLGLTTAFLLFHRNRHSILHFLSPDSDPRPLSETEQNTDRNRHQEGDESDSGAPTLPRRRGLRHRSFSDDGEEEEEKVGAEEDGFKLVSKPVPAGVKSCIKRSASPLPSPSTSTIPHSQVDSPPSRSDTPSPTPRKTVRVVDPSSERASLEALREFWAAPGVHGASSSGGGGGIAGYRRTRDIYARGQGGTAVIKRGVVKVNEGSASAEEGSGVAGNESEATTSEDSGADDATSKLERRRSPRLSIPTSSTTNAARSASSSPSPSSTSRLRPPASPTSPTARTASPSPLATSTPHVRAASPSFIVGKTARGASPSPARVASSRKRTTSREGGGAPKEDGAEVAVVVSPRWVRNKEGKGKGVMRGGAAEEEKWENGGEKEKEGEQQGVAEEGEDDGFEDVSASDVSGSSTPVLEPVLLPPLEDVAGGDRSTDSSSTAAPSAEPHPPSLSSTLNSSTTSSATLSSSDPSLAPAPAPAPTSPAPEARYSLRSRESTPSSSPAPKPPLTSTNPASPVTTLRRGSLTLPLSPTNSSELLIGSPAAPGRSGSPNGRARGAVVVL